MKKMAISAGLGIFLGLFFLFNSSTPVFFESLESKTDAGNAVFNRIGFLPSWRKDIWLMQQTHQGFSKSFGAWDRLAIVVDKTKKPYVASFFQLSSGNLEFETHPIPFKARCFACHANGPRAIRWNTNSKFVVPTLLGKMQTAVWNLRIKAYGHVLSSAGSEFSEGVPFQSKHPVFSRPLGLKTCEKCHSGGGIRNELLLEQVGTARFLVRNGFMPPFPFHTTQEEKDILEKYVESSSQ